MGLLKTERMITGNSRHCKFFSGLKWVFTSSQCFSVVFFVRKHSLLQITSLAVYLCDFYWNTEWYPSKNSLVLNVSVDHDSETSVMSYLMAKDGIDSVML